LNFSVFLGYLIKIKKESVERLFEELKIYLDAEDFNSSPNTSLNTSIENTQVHEKIKKSKPLVMDDTDEITEDLSFYYEKLRQEEEELNNQKSYTATVLSPKKKTMMESYTGTLRLRSLTDRIQRGILNVTEANELLDEIRDLVYQALLKLGHHSKKEIELEDQLMFMQLETFLIQLSQNIQLGEQWNYQIRELRRKLSEELQKHQPDYNKYHNELLATPVQQTNDYLDDDGYTLTEQFQRQIDFRDTNELESQGSNDQNEYESVESEENVQSEENVDDQEPNWQDFYQPQISPTNLDKHLKQLQTLEQLQHNYSETQLRQVQTLLKHQQELYELQQRRLSGGQYKGLEIDVEETNVDLLGNVSPVRLSPHRKPVVDRQVQVPVQTQTTSPAQDESEDDDEVRDYYTNWRSILENAHWKAELVELVTLSRAEFENEQN
jgi:peptidyl-tRNA hydrolase